MAIDADFSHHQSQANSILDLLQDRRERGATSVEVAACGGLSYTRRVSDLRKRGVDITCRQDADGHNRYWLTRFAPMVDYAARHELRRQQELFK